MAAAARNRSPPGVDPPPRAAVPDGPGGRSLTNTNVTTADGTKAKIESTLTQGAASANEVDTVTLSNSTGGTFRLAVEGETTYPIGYNASAATVEAALEDLNIVTDVTLTGNGPWTVTFVGAQANVNRDDDGVDFVNHEMKQLNNEAAHFGEKPPFEMGDMPIENHHGIPVDQGGFQ